MGENSLPSRRDSTPQDPPNALTRSCKLKKSSGGGGGGDNESIGKGSLGRSSRVD